MDANKAAVYRKSNESSEFCVQKDREMIFSNFSDLPFRNAPGRGTETGTKTAVGETRESQREQQCVSASGL